MISDYCAITLITHEFINCIFPLKTRLKTQKYNYLKPVSTDLTFLLRKPLNNPFVIFVIFVLFLIRNLTGNVNNGKITIYRSIIILRNMLNSQRNNNVNIRYISYPRQVTELPHHHHPNHRYISSNNNTNNVLHRSDTITSSRQNSSSSNQITRLVRRLVNRNSSGSNNSSNSRSLLSRTQSTRSQVTTNTPARSSTAFSSSSSNVTSSESDPFPFHNPWSNPSSSSSSSSSVNHVNHNFIQQDYSSESTRNIQPLNTSRSSRSSLHSSHSSHQLRSTRTSTSTPTPPPRPPRPPPPVSSNINAIRDYFNIIPLFHDSTHLPRSSTRRRLSNSSYHSIDQYSNNNNSSNDIIESNFHDPFNHRRYLIQNHSSQTRSNYEFEYEQEEVKQEKQKVDECYLCLESLELRGGRMIINPGCGHLLHMKCYLEYIKYFKEQCTLCKKDFGSWND
ncbi:hypothetical protein GLOIN_2v1509363 [Rhizophagus irregularis DAOM 181602=DAOM 197198]|nr:hypothetical protein GLOIN_2v1509363 [Rhizophagus irregularis DAOM 181602=DAOM 197198]